MQFKLLIGVLVLLAMLLLLKLVVAAKPRAPTRLRYKRIDLFNSTEHGFLLALRSAAPPHITVLAKVRVADILSTHATDIPAFNRIARKHVDFVLYNVQNRSVLRAVELDGPTHASQRAIKPDNVKNSCFASALVPLSRVAVADANNPEILRALFEPGPAAPDISSGGRARHTTPRSASNMAPPKGVPRERNASSN